MADDEVQQQQPINRSNPDVPSPYANNVPTPYANHSNPTDNIYEESSVPTSVPKTELDEFTTSQTHQSILTNPSHVSQIKKCTYFMDVNQGEEFKYCTEESIVSPQVPIKTVNEHFLPSNEQPLNANGFQIQQSLPTQNQLQLQTQDPMQFHQPVAQIPGLYTQPNQNYQASMLTVPNVPGPHNYQTSPPGFPVQQNFQNAAFSRLQQGQPSYQAPIFGQLTQPQYQTGDSSLPIQTNYQTGFPVLPGLPNYQTGFPVMPGQYGHQTAYPVFPGQPNFQAKMHSNYVSYKQPKLAKRNRGEANISPKKPKRKCYKFGNECEYYSAESESDHEEFEVLLEEFIEEETEFKKKIKKEHKNSTENLTGDSRSDLIKRLLNELVILMTQGKNEKRVSPKEEVANIVENNEATEVAPNVKFTMQHETKVRKYADASETSERWVVTSGAHTTGWQPGSEKITFGDDLIVDETVKCQNEIKAENSNQIDKPDNRCENLEKCEGGLNTELIKPMGQGDSNSNVMNVENYVNNSQDICSKFQNNNDTENICESIEKILKGDKSDSKKSNGECNCCHCRAVKGECTNSSPALLKKNATKLNRQKKFLELQLFVDSLLCDLNAIEKTHKKRKRSLRKLYPPSDFTLGDISEDQFSTKIPQLPVVLPPSRSKPVQPLQDSFPVTITCVTALVSTSLYVKWTIHDCYNIGGYEIYVDNYLTNRYFNGNHTAAVICNVDVNLCQKIVLVAHPKIEEIGEGPNRNTCNSISGFSYEGCQRKWTPSVYLYDPTNRD